MNSAICTHWLRAMVSALPRGGKTLAAKQLDITPSGLSKILNDPERAFDEKTIRLLSWIESSKAEKFDVEQYPIVETIDAGPMLIEVRKNPAAGQDFRVWRKKP